MKINNEITDQYIKLLEDVSIASKIIYEVTNTAGLVHYTPCPHGNVPKYPTHAWWCDGCWWRLNEALAALKAFQDEYPDSKDTSVTEIFSEKVKFLMMDGLKTTGSFHEALQYHEEDMTSKEYTAVEEFFQYCIDHEVTFGHGNIDTRIAEWQHSKEQITSDKDN